MPNYKWENNIKHLNLCHPLYSFMRGAWSKISVRLILKVHNGQDEIWRSEAAQWRCVRNSTHLQMTDYYRNLKPWQKIQGKRRQVIARQGNTKNLKIKIDGSRWKQCLSVLQVCCSSEQHHWWMWLGVVRGVHWPGTTSNSDVTASWLTLEFTSCRMYRFYWSTKRAFWIFSVFLNCFKCFIWTLKHISVITYGIPD